MRAVALRRERKRRSWPAERVRESYQGLLRGDIETLFNALRGGGAAPLPSSCRAARIRRGADAVAEYLHDFAEGWDDLLLEAQDVREETSDRVVVAGTVVGRPRGTNHFVQGAFRHELRFLGHELAELRATFV